MSVSLTKNINGIENKACGTCHSFRPLTDYTIEDNSFLKNKSEYKTCMKCRNNLVKYRRKRGLQNVHEKTICKCGVKYFPSREEAHFKTKNHFFRIATIERAERKDIKQQEIKNE